MRLRRFAALPLLALALTACGGSAGSDGASAGSDGSTAATATTVGGSVSDDLTAKPVVELPDDPAPTTLLTKDIVVGDGEEAGTSGKVTVQYLGLLYDGGTEFDSSWDRGAEPITFPLDGVIPGFSQGITGMKVGGRRQIVIPSALGYGAQGSPPTIPADADLVFVVDLLGVGEPDIAPAVAQGGADETGITVSSDLATKPTIEVPPAGGPRPTTLLTEDVVVGAGDLAPGAGDVTVQYVGVRLSDGVEFDSSWKTGEPATFGLDRVIPGFAQGIEGMAVGTRRIIVIPAALGYGASGQGEEIPPDTDLVFVVDLVAVGSAGN